MQSTAGFSKITLSVLVALALIACVFISESMCGKGKGGGQEDIILYNGNIVMRGGGGKKGKGGGSIVVANSHGGGHKQHIEFLPMMWGWGHGGHGGH